MIFFAMCSHCAVFCDTALMCREAAFRVIQAVLDFSDKSQSARAQAPFNKRRKLSDSIVEDEERAAQRRRSDQSTEMEEEDDMGEENDEDRQMSRLRAVRRMILNTPAFVPYFRPEIFAAYQPPSLYHDAPPSSMFM
jgi:hypothetical protein